MTVNIFAFQQLTPDFFRGFRAKKYLFAAFLFDEYISEATRFNHAEFNPFFVLDFFLQTANKIFIGFIGHDRQCIDIKPMNACSVLVNRNTQPASDFLTFLEVRFCFVQCAYLENIRIVPTFFQRGVGKNKFQLRIKTE